MKFGTLVQHAPGYKVASDFSIFAQGLSYVMVFQSRKNRVKSSLNFSFHFISLHIFYEDCRKVTYILVKAALLRGY